MGGLGSKGTNSMWNQIKLGKMTAEELSKGAGKGRGSLGSLVGEMEGAKNGWICLI